MNDPEKFSWNNYIEKTKDSPPKKLLVEALKFVKERNEALDLGPGALNETKSLISEGFKHVTVVDNEKSVKDEIDKISDIRIESHAQSFEDFEFPQNKYDLVCALDSLPFIASLENISVVLEKIKNSLKSEGVLVATFFGVNDSWNTPTSTKTFMSLEDVRGLLSDLEILGIREKEKDTTTALGTAKHLHIIRVIARKQ